MRVQQNMENQHGPATAALSQSLGGLYLLVAVLLLFMLVVLAVNGLVFSRGQGTAPAAPTAPVIAAPKDEERAALYGKLSELGADLAADAVERNRLAQRLEGLLAIRNELALQSGKPGESTGIAAPADTRHSLLNSIDEVERELAAVAQALEVSEKRISANQIQIAGLGARLNRALLEKVEELQRDRSEFFSRLRTVLGDRPGFKVEGDRFALPSEILFKPGADTLLPQGAEEVRRLAATILSVSRELPAGMNWVLRVDGHTDSRPIASVRFPSNWELSTMRAVTVVKALIAAGVPPEHVAAAGFGEFKPVARDGDDAALARNRRIEFRLDQP
ncbi:MAG: OmpA family protein [Rhodospirillaceae bacterium]|nr:OmpA family protein [Rhodospirillales bacterium]